MSNQAVADIQFRIKALTELDEEDLKDAMTDLKAALMENPDACALLLPQDVGQIVSALMKITGKDVVASLSGTKKRASSSSRKRELAALKEEAADDF